jgi:hypothetical protein
MMTLSPASALPDLGTQREMATAAPELVQAARDVLLQGLGLLFELSDGTYSRSVGAPFHAAIGSHYRNVLERFHSLVHGLRAGEIDYGSIYGGSRLQGDVRYASVATCDVLRALRPYTEETLQRGCRVMSGVGHGAAPSVARDSNISRELAYCVGQALYHYGIIRLMCKEFGITAPAEFGIAPSTAEHKAAAAS